MKIPIKVQAILFLVAAAAFLVYNFYVRSSSIALMFGSFCLTVGIITLVKSLSIKNKQQDRPE